MCWRCLQQIILVISGMKWESELRQEKLQNWISKWTKKETIWKIPNFENSQFGHLVTWPIYPIVKWFPPLSNTYVKCVFKVEPENKLETHFCILGTYFWIEKKLIHQFLTNSSIATNNQLYLIYHFVSYLVWFINMTHTLYNVEHSVFCR